MIFSVFLFHFVIVFSMAFTAGLIGASHYTLSILVGGAIAGFSFIFILWTWSTIFSKKSVALASGVIVIKYAILIGLISLAVTLDGVTIPGLAVGLSSLFPSLAVFVYRNRNLGETDGAF